jgi:hypothetical protein
VLWDPRIGLSPFGLQTAVHLVLAGRVPSRLVRCDAGTDLASILFGRGLADGVPRRTEDAEMKGFRRIGLTVVATLAVAGCGTTNPPTEKVEVAEAAVMQADTQGAGEEGALELRLAREKLEKAREAMEDERYVTARRLAEQAQVDALLAEAKAESAAALASAHEMREGIESLRSEAERAAGEGPEPPGSPGTQEIPR